MNDLRDRVHAGIGAAGGDHADGVPGDFTDGFFQRVLYAATRGLRLETAEREARILDRERDPHGRDVESQDKVVLAIYSRRRSARKASGGRALFA